MYFFNCHQMHVILYSLIKAVTILYEIIQFLSGIFNHVLVELDSMVYTKWPWEGEKNNIFSLTFK